MTGGPLAGVRVVELASIGPGPFAGMMLADHGADVVRIEKPGGRPVGTVHFDKDPMLRGRRRINLDLKKADDVASALDLIEHADVLLEGFRPGVTERLGLGPQICHERNPALVYGRMTGWGQDGPLAPRAGHDINYIAVTGALDAIGTPGSGPVPPMNLIGDFGGGGMLMAFGICAALLQARIGGRGCVVDAAMTEGTALLMTMPYALKGLGFWDGGRGNNFLDGGAPYYGTYETSDGKWIAIGAIEEPFWQELVDKLDLDRSLAIKRMDRTFWPALRMMIEEKIASGTRDHWDALFQGSDGCVAPVMTMDEAHRHPHNKKRGVFEKVDGIVQAAPAPRFDSTRPEIRSNEVEPVEPETVLNDWASRTR